MGAYIIRRILISIPVLLGITIIGFVALQARARGSAARPRSNPEVLANLAVASGDPRAAERHRLGLRPADLPQPVPDLAGRRPPGRPRLLGHVPPLDRRRDRLADPADAVADGHGARRWPSSSASRSASSPPSGSTRSSTTSSTRRRSSSPRRRCSCSGSSSIYIFAVNLHVLADRPGRTRSGRPTSVDAFYHLILPATVLAIVNAAPLVRYTRASMLDVLNSEYVTTARSKGLRHRLVIMRHAFRNGAHPDHHDRGAARSRRPSPAPSSPSRSSPGTGWASSPSRRPSARDPSLMMGIILITGIAVLVANIIADIGYAVADPRVRI